MKGRDKGGAGYGTSELGYCGKVGMRIIMGNHVRPGFWIFFWFLVRILCICFLLLFNVFNTGAVLRSS